MPTSPARQPETELPRDDAVRWQQVADEDPIEDGQADENDDEPAQ